jgi:hypothetical protein
MKPTARILCGPSMKGRPVVARAIAPSTPWADLSKTGDNTDVDEAVVLLAAAAEVYATGGSWLSRPLGAPTRYCTGGSDWRISASTGFGGNAVRINSLALSSWPIPTVYVH